ncbi:Peptidase M20 domain-containing protein 2 [Holothuria leucospilota]|uniref:Peptidase M20 domain-containing protein 2 n=1 Tax=Holothuria leucospilota TaxID=206669 RepID=A0A9Q1H6Y3_HOLLE|nr:Peptidase M20 domain-containing protein 2 [Holothuria leucospilota]
MIEGSAFTGSDVALMVHPCPESAVVMPSYARKKVAYTFHGKAAHAAMSPWMGNNALDAAVQCYNSISAKRQQFKPTVRVHGVFTNGGDRPNIIPEEAELLYYIRAPTTAELEPVVKKCEACAKGAALASDCTVDIKYQGYYAEVITNRNLAQLYRKHCEDMGVEFSNDPAIAKSLGAPDAQKPTLIQAKALALTAIQLLQPGGDKLMKSIKAEFKEISPNPMINSSYSFTNC